MSVINFGNKAGSFALCAGAAAIILFVFVRLVSPPDTKEEFDDLLINSMVFSAEETAAFLGNEKKVVILSSGPEQAAVLGEMAETFRKTLEKQGVQVLAVESDDDRGEPFILPGFFPGSQLLQLVDNYPTVDAIISLVGIPYFKGAVPEVKPILISAYGAIAERGVNVQIQSGLLSMAIVRRVGSSEETQPSKKNSRAWFEQNLQVITAENVEVLYE